MPFTNKYKVDKKEFIKLYNELGALSLVAKKLNISWNVAERRRKTWDIPKKISRIASYHFNEYYFDKIDSSDKAFWLGFVFGNSHLDFQNKRAPCLQVGKKDKNLLIGLGKALCGNNKIIKNSKDMYYICFTSKHLCETLSAYGKAEKKDTTFPKINSNFHYDFIGGFVRGNSSSFLIKNQLTLDVHGPISFLKEIKNIINIGGSIGRPSRSRHGYNLRYSGRNQIKKLKELKIL